MEPFSNAGLNQSSFSVQFLLKNISVSFPYIARIKCRVIVSFFPSTISGRKDAQNWMNAIGSGPPSTS